jgi:hypothetical protein
MIASIPFDDENIVGFRLDGEIDEAGVQRVAEEIVAKSAVSGKVRIYGEINNIEGWNNLKAFFTNIQIKFKALGKIEKYAVVSDKKWLENWEKVAEFITPFTDVKLFKTTEREAAIAWLQQPTREESHALAILPVTPGYVLGFSVSGTLTKADYDLLNRRMAEHLLIHKDLRLYCEIIDLQGITLKGFWEDLKTSVQYYTDVKKAAVVAADSWWKAGVAVTDFFTPGVRLKYFSPGQKADALDWLS